jgi:hypothetical protein
VLQGNDSGQPASQQIGLQRKEDQSPVRHAGQAFSKVNLSGSDSGEAGVNASLNEKQTIPYDACPAHGDFLSGFNWTWMQAKDFGFFYFIGRFFSNP